MTLLFTRQFLLIAILLTVAHSHAVIQPRDAPPKLNMAINFIDKDTISWEGWEISGCGIPTSAKVNDLLGFLFQFQPHVEAVIADFPQSERAVRWRAESPINVSCIK